jgi:hypothetical protein
MDRGVPTEEVLTEMRTSVPPIYYLVGTPKGRLSKLEADLFWRNQNKDLIVRRLAFSRFSAREIAPPLLPVH